MKKTLRKAVTGFRWTVILFCALVLTINGASSAQRLFDGYQAPEPAETTVAEVAQVQPGPSAPEDAPGSMTPSGKPNCEPSAHITAQLILDSNNSQSRLPSSRSPISGESTISATSDSNSSIRATAFSVSPGLGIRFTLVGAKPSGTS